MAEFWRMRSGGGRSRALCVEDHTTGVEAGDVRSMRTGRVGMENGGAISRGIRPIVSVMAL